jgi:hypothetical protein
MPVHTLGLHVPPAIRTDDAAVKREAACGRLGDTLSVPVAWTIDSSYEGNLLE